MKPLVFNTTLIVINALLSQFNLRWDDDFLVYYSKLNHEVVEIEISPDFNDVLKLLGLPNDIGSNIEYDAHAIATSRYFNWKVLKKYSPQLKPFLDVLSDFNYESSKHIGDKLDVIKSLKKHLKYDISYLVWSIIPKNYSKKESRNKFNGHLVKHWLKVDDVTVVTTTIIEFKQYIKSIDYNCFDYYVYSTSSKQIRQDFLTFKLEDYFMKNKTNMKSLPF